MIDKVEQSGSQRPRHRCYSPLSIISNAGLRPDFPAERPRKTVYRFSHDFIATEVFGKLGLPHSWVRIVHFPENPALKMSYGTNIQNDTYSYAESPVFGQEGCVQTKKAELQAGSSGEAGQFCRSTWYLNYSESH